MNPLMWFAILAPTALVGLLVYLLVYQHTDATARVERERQHLEALRFDRDFARAWKGQDLDASGLDERITAAEERLRTEEQKAAERQKPLEDLAHRLDQISRGADVDVSQ